MLEVTREGDSIGTKSVIFFLSTIALFTHALPFCIQFPFSFALEAFENF